MRKDLYCCNDMKNVKIWKIEMNMKDVNNIDNKL